MSAGVTGLVGKLPAHGDFVRRGGPAALLSTIDRWLDAELTAAPALHDRLEALDGWRFVARIDAAPVTGAMVASEDAVGRRFPLLAIRAGDADAGWADGAASVLAQARDTGLRADDAAAALGALEAMGDDGRTGWWRAGGEVVLANPVLPRGEDFARLFDGAVA